MFKDRIVDLFFPENDLASSAVRCAPSAVVCIHRLHALYKPYIYMYILYISFCLFYFTFSKIELMIMFPENDLASSAVRCAPSAVVCIHRLHAL